MIRDISNRPAVRRRRRWPARRVSSFAAAATAIVVPLSVVAPVAQGADTTGTQVPVRANANGAGYDDADGRQWSADQAYRQGEWGFGTVYGSGSIGESIAGTDDDALYQSYNYFDGGSGYTFDVPDGSYEVTLKMVEDWATAPGQRVFDVHSGSETVLTGVDIHAECGSLTACDRSFTTTVSDGRLSVGFTMNGGASYATLSAISVVPDDGTPDPDPDPEPPAAPQDVSATASGPSQVDVTWADNDEPDVDGYKVYRSTEPGFEVGAGTLVAEDIAVSSYSDSGRSPETTYYYRVSAVDDTGAESAPSSEVSATTPRRDDDTPDGHTRVAYFTQWGIYDRDFLVRDVDVSGAAGQLTHINYAFADVDQNLECATGDAFADHNKAFSAEESVDGAADSWDQPLRGNFNELAELKEKHPDLKVMLSLGGWTWSGNFSDAALTQESREHFVESCVDRFIEGNVPGLPDGAAAGVFDGIDVDWEWPGSEGAPGNVIRQEDKRNYTLLLEEFRRQLDELGSETGEHYELTAFLPAAPEKIEAGIEIDGVFDALDYATVQGYDFHGAWDDETNHQAQLFSPPGDPTPQRWSADLAATTYLDGGAEPSEIVLGVPAYGRGWSGVPGTDDGLYQDAAGPADGTYEQGIEDYHVLKDKPGQRFRDDEHGALWLYDGDEWWSYDDPAVLERKAEYITDRGLGGSMMWSLDGDDANATLTSTLADALP
ncbi:chitinase [Haloechinothrix alba]|uniref:chitinase n=1 Tax=Haloechinothrix alba TaxID=664784 RepID=A0A238VWT3_9PSEU|nr:chitinase [Haloechinothrix alba]